MLMKRAVTLERGGATVQLAGIDDLNAGAPDLDAALAGPPLLLLSHNPDVFFVAALRGVRLVFSGHTHGGQVRIPGLPVLVRMSRFRLDEGHYATGDAQLVVSRGLGVSGIPLRVACPPEAMLLTLEPASRP
jgi:predicted MPP superfamily phosphohydrolase